MSRSSLTTPSPWVTHRRGTFVDDGACPQTSSRIAFDTPKLEAGKEYHYTLRVEGAQGGRTRTESRRIAFQAGTEVEVDFSDLPAVAGR